MEKAVAGQKKRKSEIETPDALTVGDVLKHVSLEELQQFVVRQAKYNVELTNALMLEFLHKTRSGSTNPYSGILRKALGKVHFDYDDYYDYEYGLEIEPLNEWLDKAETCRAQGEIQGSALDLSSLHGGICRLVSGCGRRNL